MSHNEKGFTLVEVLVSIVVVSTLAGAMMSIFSQSLRITSSDLDRTVANQIAQNTLHTIERRAKETDTLFSLDTLKKDVNGTCDLCSATINGRDYSIDIDSVQTSSNVMDVTIIVDSDTLLQPITLKGVVTDASLHEKFPETSNPEATTL